MLKVSAFYRCPSPGVPPAQAATFLFAGSTSSEMSVYPKDTYTHAHPHNHIQMQLGEYTAAHQHPSGLTPVTSTNFHSCIRVSLVAGS